MRNFQTLSREQQYRRKKLADQLGVGVDEVPDPRGKHGHQARGKRHGRWNATRIISEHGYVKVRVGREHPLADPNGYAYEHLLVWVSAGRIPPGPNELLHHVDETDKTDNRLGNLEMKTRSAHGQHHIKGLERDQKTGRIVGKKRRMREYPVVASQAKGE